MNDQPEKTNIIEGLIDDSVKSVVLIIDELDKVDKPGRLDKPDEPDKTIIKHLVISGGGVSGFSAYGVLRESNKAGFWDFDNIKSIYGTSIGAILSVMMVLNYDWDILDDYFIKRPWNNIFKINMGSILNSFQNCGILNIKVIEEVFLPLFNGKDIPLSITISEFYELTNIELHIYGTEMTKFEYIDFNYKTFPEWRLLDAVYCSCCLPILFSPFSFNNKLYFDGGTFNNYPITHCLNNTSCPDEILGICNNIGTDNDKDKDNDKDNDNDKDKDNKSTKPSTLFDYLLTLFIKMLKRISSKSEIVSIKNEIKIDSKMISLYNIYYACSNIMERIRLIENGVNAWNEWINRSVSLQSDQEVKNNTITAITSISNI